MPSTFTTMNAFAATKALTLLSLLAVPTYARRHDHSTLSRMNFAKRDTYTYEGCYSASSGLSNQGSYQYQTNSYCQPICQGQSQTVFGLSGGSDCWCGNTLPPANSKVDDSNCNTPCFGFGSQNCGGSNFWSVYLTGTESAPNYSGSGSSSASASSSSSPQTLSSTTSSAPAGTSAPAASSSSTSSTPTSATPIVVTSVAPGSTVVVTEPAAHITSAAAATPTPENKSSHSNVAGVAAGVVVGVLAIAAIIGGLVFFLRRKRRQAAEDEHKRSTQVRDFMNGGSHEPKPPGTAYSNMSDMRLDPEAGRRNSAGSIADDQDYSRRILRVANPDGS